MLLHSFVVRSRSIYSSMFDCTTVSVGRPSGHHHKVGTKPGVAKFTPFSKNIEYRGGGTGGDTHSGVTRDLHKI